MSPPPSTRSATPTRRGTWRSRLRSVGWRKAPGRPGTLGDRPW